MTAAAADVVSLSFLGSFVGPAVAWVATRDTWWLWLLAGLFGANATVAAAKDATRWAGVRSGWLVRPAGARGCDAFCVAGASGGAPGFPSGHMTTVATVVAGAWLGLREKSDGTRLLVVLLGVPWIAAMAWARWAKKCHSVLQILAGVLWGFTVAAAIGWVSGRVRPVRRLSD
jgi:membrane-associated phospholipid phosphatase